MIDTVHLNFNLNEEVTHVTSKLAFKPNYQANGSTPALTLNGRPDVKLVEVKLAGTGFDRPLFPLSINYGPSKERSTGTVTVTGRYSSTPAAGASTAVAAC
jgi:aminopeptidase N